MSISPPHCDPSLPLNAARLRYLSQLATAQDREPKIAVEVTTTGDKEIGIIDHRTIRKPWRGGVPKKPVYSDRRERWDSINETALCLAVNLSAVQRAITHGSKCCGRRLGNREFAIEEAKV